jgi:hypothetical protein
MNAPSEDVKDILDGESELGLTYGTDLFISEMPSIPDACVCVYDSGGYAPDGCLDGAQFERPTIQIQVRGARGGYLIAHELAQSIRDALHGLADYEINGARYLGMWLEGDVNYIGQDDNNRPILSLNFRLERTDA